MFNLDVYPLLIRGLVVRVELFSISMYYNFQIIQVRWQHEDDIPDCQGCRKSFAHNTSSKRKHHCRHCGRIFCVDCLSKSVPGGPHGRPTRVCDVRKYLLFFSIKFSWTFTFSKISISFIAFFTLQVCHTLLVQNSAPYFSTDAPQLAN